MTFESVPLAKVPRGGLFWCQPVPLSHEEVQERYSPSPTTHKSGLVISSTCYNTSHKTGPSLGLAESSLVFVLVPKSELERLFLLSFSLYQKAHLVGGAADEKEEDYKAWSQKQSLYLNQCASLFKIASLGVRQKKMLRG